MCVLRTPSLLPRIRRKYVGRTLPPLIWVSFLASFITWQLCPQTNNCSREERPTYSPVTLLDYTSVEEGGIYLLETSGNPFLTPKQLCAMESIAHHNPNLPVAVGIYSHHLLETTALEHLVDHHSNIGVFQIDPEAILKGTIFTKQDLERLLKRTGAVNRVPRLSDILRLALVHSKGGIYLDMDSIVLRPLTNLINAVSEEVEGRGTVGNCPLVFEKGHPFLEKYMEIIKDQLSSSIPDTWTALGPPLMRSAVNKWCGKPAGSKVPPTHCNGLEILPAKLFNPVHPWQLIFSEDPDTAKIVLQATKGSFTVHLWNGRSGSASIWTQSKSAIGQLAAKNCPLMSKFFGGELWGRPHLYN